MTQPRLIVSTLFTALALAAVAAGCSGGNPGGSLPISPGSPSDAAARRKHPVGAVLRIHIPPRPKHPKRGAHYVSPNTQSITVAVKYVTTSPWPSLPPQTLVVNSQNCHLVGEGEGQNCSFTVQAYVGQNQFTFNEYATKSPTPQDIPLGTLTSQTNISRGDPAISFTLEGVVNQVALTVPNPESTQNAATQVTETMPIGTAGTFTLYVNPKDASGASIATDIFSSPITIQVSPANSGVSLSLNKQCDGDISTPAKVTLYCALDLDNVTASYDGTVTQTGVNAYVDSAKIVAAPQLASPTPQPATVALTSNLLGYQLVPPPGGSPDVSVSNLALDPVSGNLLFSYSNQGLNPELIELNPTNPAASPVTHPIGFGVREVAFDATGHIWTDDVTSPALHCFTSFGGSAVTVGVEDGLGTAIGELFIMPDGAGHIWYTGEDPTYYASIGFFTGSCTAGSHQAQFLIGSQNQSPVGLTLAQPVAGKAAVGMVAYGGTSNLYTANIATSASPTPAAPYPSGEYPEGMIGDKAYNAYVVFDGTNAGVSKIPAGTAAISTFATLLPNSYPYGLDQYSGSQSTAQALAIVDGTYEAAALINPAATTTEPLEIVADESYECDSIAYDKTGGVWEICTHGDGSVWAYHPIVTSTWSALPSAYQYTYDYGTVLTIAEKSGVDNSPFTVIGNTDPSIIATAGPSSAPLPVRNQHFAVSPFHHAIPININNTGTDILTISDKNGRTQSFSIVVSPSGVEAGARHHRDRRRHGAKP